MPRARLIPIMTVVQAVSNLSNGNASILEILDAFHQCYDFDNMMMYRDIGSGLAQPLDGEPFDEFGGFQERREMSDSIFDCCCSTDPDATIRHDWANYRPDEILMTKVDGLNLALALWGLFEPNKTFDVDSFQKITGVPCKPSPKVEILTLEKALDDELKSPGCWPWGNHQTELLGHLEEAAREFWTGYDPQNAKATAPKNDTVISWLKERKVSDQMARAIATMLRADDLPTGPRK